MIEIGSQFGKLVVVGERYAVFSVGACKMKRFYYPCICECGNKIDMRQDMLLQAPRGRLEHSCGCLRRAALIGNVPTNKTHGLADHPLRSKWSGMRSRCHNPESIQYADYGGRGITVCGEWRASLPAFAEWAFANGYEEGLDIDRINNEAGYSPDNCRWVSRKVNCRNKRNTVFIHAFGELKPLADWAEDPRCPVAYPTLSQRLKRGWSPEEAITAKAWSL